MRFCARCVIPDTKPDVRFDAEGVCSGCRAYERRQAVDWTDRERQLVDLVKQRASGPYDVVVPSSGGKDSHFQVITALRLGLRPLAVTVTPDHQTEIGRRNVENVKRLGVDTVEVTPDPVLRRRINAYALKEVGDISWPEHVLIFTAPVRVALQLGVRTVLWGENPQDEYGAGPESARDAETIGRPWLEEFGGLLGLRVSDLPAALGVDAAALWWYTYPPTDEARDRVLGVFLGKYVPWDGYLNAVEAARYGFEWSADFVEGSGCKYENLDNAQTGIHDYCKWLKYGFGRATDVASLHVRRGRMTRGQAVNHVRVWDGRFPETYIGVGLDKLLSEVAMTRKDFLIVCDRFTNRAVFGHPPRHRDDGSPERRDEP